MPMLEIPMIASASGRCSSVSCAMVNWGNRGGLLAADADELSAETDELWPARKPRPADSSATSAPPSLLLVVIERFPLVLISGLMFPIGNFWS
jgi:hypothetical protein